MGSERVHVVLAAEERVAYKAAAEREGKSLSAWLRAAAEARLAATEASGLATVAELDAFFTACDQREGEALEPDWSDHLAVMSASRRSTEPT